MTTGELPYLDLPRRDLATVLRQRYGIREGSPVTHEELGDGVIVRFAGSTYATVDFKSGARFCIHLTELTVVLPTAPAEIAP